MHKLVIKLRDKSGESIGETLVALLVMCLAMMVISGGIVTAARINNRATQLKTATTLNLSDKDLSADTGAKVTVEGGGTGETKTSTNVSVILYTDSTNSNDKDHFRFYELKTGD